MTNATRWARRVLFALLGIAVLYGAARLWIGAVAASRLAEEVGRIRDAGEPVTLAEAIPPVPPAENAAPWIAAAASQIAAEPEMDALAPFLNDPASASAATAEEVAAWVERSGPALETLLAAVRDHPRCRFGGAEGAPSPRFDEIPHVLQLSRLATARAGLASRRGDASAALADARLLDLLGDRVGDSPLILHRLVGMAVQGVGAGVVEHALARGRPTEEAIGAWRRQLASVPARRIDRAAVLAERAYVCTLFDRLDGETLGFLGVPGQGSVIDAGLCLLFERPALVLAQARTLRQWTSTLPLVERPWSEVAAAWHDLESSDRRDAPWYERYAGGAIPLGANACRKAAANEARRDLVGLALRLESYEASHGTLPARLADLGPEPLPPDPVSGLPFVYRATDGGRGYVLYGVGENRRDDGGVEAGAPNAAGADDLAFRRPPR